MNYLTEIKAYYDWLECNPLEATHISLWHGLMSIANKCGWKEEFTVPISTLELKTGIKRTNLYKARNRLKQAGLITFRERDGSQSAMYKLSSLCALNEYKSEHSGDSTVTSRRQTGNSTVSNGYNINKQYKTKPKQDEYNIYPKSDRLSKFDF